MKRETYSFFSFFFKSLMSQSARLTESSTLKDEGTVLWKFAQIPARMMAEKRLLSSMCCDVSFIYLFLYMGVCNSLCADIHGKDISAVKTPPVRKEERRQGN